MILIRPFSLCDVQVVPPEIEGPWLVDYDIPTWQIYALLYMEPQPNDEWISFGEAYRRRWMERAKQCSDGRFFIVNGSSIRTPLSEWAKARGYYVYFKPEEICFPHSTELPL